MCVNPWYKKNERGVFTNVPNVNTKQQSSEDQQLIKCELMPNAKVLIRFSTGKMFSQASSSQIIM